MKSGIPGKALPHQKFDQIFEEFYQIGNRERDRARGLGMGLAIVRRLADLMRAPLKFASRPGVGSVFKLRLPVSSPANSQRKPDAAPGSGCAARILRRKGIGR